MKRSEMRRQAMQLLYQLDLRGEEEADQILATAGEGSSEDDLPGPEAVELARTAWAARQQADERVSRMADQWPTHRQPPIDRSILRLALHEMDQGLPPAVAINEAVELAKRFGAEQSPAFINGVLDKIASQRGGSDVPVADEAPKSSEQEA
ncbi:MAG: transcription antitermination factor NusB [Phycisphaeraceae bacterium]|nr:transcription antitermination factor NusB [Phycisphaeraceae bacterium]